MTEANMNNARVRKIEEVLIAQSASDGDASIVGQ